jgi:hypothetical protein
MNHELRPEIATPTHTHVARLTLAGLGCGLVGAGAMIAARPSPVAQEPAAPITITETVTVPMSVPVVMSQEPPPPSASQQIALVFKAGGATYMKLVGLGEDATDESMPRHGKAVLFEDDYITSSIAHVEDKDVPLAQRAWLGNSVTVDGTCTAKVIGFAVVARLNGYPGYAGIEDTDTWTATSAMEHGAKVLAARLDNCAGGTYARDASLAPIIVPRVVDDAPLAAAATKALYATSEVKSAQAEWKTAEQTGIWYKNESTTTQTQVLRHPKTGATWVSVHLYYGGTCGLPNLSVWGLYRADAGGKLTRVTSSLGELTSIEKLVDIDGDGQLEVIGTPWLGTERAVQSVGGEGISELSLPFYSCPC